MKNLSFDAVDWDEEVFWQAILSRAEKWDGAFVYGVLSTRIFCRPSCPSRRPQREGARFFQSSEAAIQAGFRVCKRCRPEQFQTLQAARVEQACRLIEANEDAPLSLEELSHRVGSSPHHLQRTFKQTTGTTPRKYAAALRLGHLKTKLREDGTVLDALYESGYGSVRGLYERGSSQLGMTPATYQRGGKGAQITFVVAPCSLGFLLVAATEKGVCAVSLGDAPDELEADLRAEFPNAEIKSDAEQMSQSLQAVLELLENDTARAELSLDIRATAFQARVWQALRAIPRGETRTYSQVAQSIGQPTAARAVARACATNAAALIIPCHRVVRGDGSLSGYRWGVERKRKLLEREDGEE